MSLLYRPYANASQESQALANLLEDLAWHEHASQAHSLPPSVEGAEGALNLDDIQAQYRQEKKEMCLLCM